ncbi:MAG: NAD-dependent epimerase/dehydratase family protein [Caldilineaceae bacterium]
MTKQRILILGGSGFVSGTLARMAVARGHDVWTVTRGQRTSVDGTTALIADRKEAGALEQAVAASNTEWDLVVDCIGFDPADARQDIALFRARTPRLVFISTDFVYDPLRRVFPQGEETDHYLLDYAPDTYGGKKRLCELEFMHGDCGDMAWTVFRPGHIYGPGSLLGCLPEHGRDPELLAKMRAGETLQLVGGGYFLQQPVFAPDLAELILSAPGNEASRNQIYCSPGPEIIESKMFYQIIADLLGVELKIGEIAVDQYWAANPDRASFLCHRIYDLSKLRASGLRAPSTGMREGLRVHVGSMG